MKKHVNLISCLIIGAAVLAVFTGQDVWSEGPVRQSYIHAEIFPDYNNVTIPPNIAPLNFNILEAGERFRVSIQPTHGDEMVFENNDGLIQFSEKAWKSMLMANRGAGFTIDISVLTDHQWVAFPTITTTVAPEKIDSHLVYRLLN